MMAGLNSFTGHSILACGTLRPELKWLQDEGFLDPDQLLFTAPGLHEDCKELKRQLLRQLEKAGSTSERVIVLYGSRCYIDSEDMARGMDELLAEQPGDLRRIDASNCVDMIASKQQREEIAAGQAVYWLTSGWLTYWKAIFKDWDAAKANETFPKYDKAILLDPLGTYEEYVSSSPEKLLEFSDWMKIPIEPYPVSLDRLRDLLADKLRSQ